MVIASSGCQEVADSSVLPPGDDASPPLEIKFLQSCGLPEGRQQVYDPKTGIFHIHFHKPSRIGGFGSGLYKRSAFEVTKVATRFVKPVVFRLTGVPASYGCVGDPLALCVGGGFQDHLRLDGKTYALVDDPLASGQVDKRLFRVQRKNDRVTVEFTEEGQALLKPGVLISFKIDTGW
jgi:hypothetical protein